MSGLDAEATAIANDLWNGEAVEQARLARILWLGVLEFADTVARAAAGARASRSTWRSPWTRRSGCGASRRTWSPACRCCRRRRARDGALEVPGTVRIPVAVLAERRPGATPWAEWSWRAVEVLEERRPTCRPGRCCARKRAAPCSWPAGPRWSCTRPTPPITATTCRPTRRASGWCCAKRRRRPAFACTRSRWTPARRISTPMSAPTCWNPSPCRAGLRSAVEAFVAQHHVERVFHKRRRDRADPETPARAAEGRRAPRCEEDED